MFPGGVKVIGNFPYNISSQIFFKILENRDLVPESVGMVQKEVAVQDWRSRPAAAITAS